MSARTCSSTRLLIGSGGPYRPTPAHLTVFEFRPALLGTEIVRRPARFGRQRRRWRHKRAAHRVAYQLHRRRLRPAPRRPPGRFQDSVHHAPEDPRDDQNQDAEQEVADHWFVLFPPAAWAAATPSRARRAACPSAESGARSTTFFHSSAAAPRFSLPKARTMPLLSSVFVCFGSSFNEC